MSKPKKDNNDDVDEENEEGGDDVGDLSEFQKKKPQAVSKKQKVFWIHTTKESFNENIIITLLPHPKRGLPARYLIHNNTIQEIQRVLEEPSSYFIDDFVQKDGSLYICTPVDPLFIAIPILEATRKKTTERPGYFVQWELLFGDNSESDFSYLRKIITEADISLVCDVNNEFSDPLYRLNDDKVLAWLRCKVDILTENLENSNDNVVQSSAQASTFRTSTKEAKRTPAAFGFLSEYISASWLQKLTNSYGISNFGVAKYTALDEIATPKKRSSNATDSKPKQEPAKKARASASQNKLAKVNKKGMAKMESFFQKK